MGYLRPYTTVLALAMVAMVGLAASTGLYPLLLQLLLTVLIEGQHGAMGSLEPTFDKLVLVLGSLGFEFDMTTLRATLEVHILWFFAAVVFVKAVCQAVRFFGMGWIAQRVVWDLRRALFGSILKQSGKFFGEESTGQLVSRLMNDVNHVERAATYAIPVFFGDALKVLVLALICLIQYRKLAVISGVLLVAILPIVFFGRKLKRYAKKAQLSIGQLTSRITETLSGIRIIQIYGREKFEIERFDTENKIYFKAMLKSVLIRALQTPVMELVGVGALLLTVAHALSSADAKESDPAQVVGFLLALVLLYEPVKALGRLNAIIMPGVAAAERVFEVMDRPSDVVESADAKPFEERPERVKFERVTFGYRPDEPVLKDFELELARGRMVALVGPSGGGKSTIAALLPRLFDVDSGRITVNGVDIREFSLESLRLQVAMVSQEPYLFNDSLEMNIAYGRPEATRSDVEAAAKMAVAHRFIAASPQGYDSLAGERGLELSGGERQRISIARAIVRDAGIIILDEATSALDTSNEQELQKLMGSLRKNRIMLVIAHRLSTVRTADHIVFVEAGRVVEEGTHDALIRGNGPYARLIRASEGQACI